MNKKQSNKMREMKDSGISWVGEIPKEWRCLPIRALFTENRNKNFLGKETKALQFKYGTIVPKKNFDHEENYVAETILNYNIVDRGMIMLNGLNLNFDFVSKRVALVAERGIITSAYMSFYPTDTTIVLSEYANYLLKSYDNCAAFHNMGGGVRKILNFDELKRQYFVLPPLDEQQRIAEFLDRECGKIDGLKADIQAQIDTLEQYKRSVITEAVTHGLNLSAPMKDSGIPWVGNIPKHWNCCSLKYNYNTISGATPNSNDISLWDGEIVWVTPADYKTKDVYVFSGARKITYKGYLSCSTTLIKQGNIIFSKRAPIGSVAINKVELCTSQGCLSVVRKTGNVNNKYFYYLFSVNDETFNLFGSGTTFKEISAKDFLSVKFPLPPLDEQQEIADYLDNKCAEIEQIIADKKSQIETLDGYKKSLIYEYVTGKKEVYYV